MYKLKFIDNQFMKITKIDENTVEGITQCTTSPPLPPPPFYWCVHVGGERGIKHPTKFLKKKGGGLAGFQFLEVVARKQRGDFFQGELQFLHKR